MLEKWLAERRNDYLDGHDPSRARRQTLGAYLQEWVERLAVVRRTRSEFPRARTIIDG